MQFKPEVLAGVDGSSTLFLRAVGLLYRLKFTAFEAYMRFMNKKCCSRASSIKASHTFGCVQGDCVAAILHYIISIVNNRQTRKTFEEVLQHIPSLNIGSFLVPVKERRLVTERDLHTVFDNVPKLSGKACKWVRMQKGEERREPAQKGEEQKKQEPVQKGEQQEKQDSVQEKGEEQKKQEPVQKGEQQEPVQEEDQKSAFAQKRKREDSQQDEGEDPEQVQRKKRLEEISMDLTKRIAKNRERKQKEWEARLERERQEKLRKEREMNLKQYMQLVWVKERLETQLAVDVLLSFKK